MSDSRAVVDINGVRGAVGLVLWQTVRDVTLWATTAEEQRDGLFASNAATARLHDSSLRDTRRWRHRSRRSPGERTIAHPARLAAEAPLGGW